MLFINHRINNSEELKFVKQGHGVEIDLRDKNNDIILSHDPFVEGELFEDYLKNYVNEKLDKNLIILNIKSERIEYKVLELIKKYNIHNYFFLDSSFPMIYQLNKIGEKNIAVRFSEFESIESVKLVKDMVKWVWVDCFTSFPLDLSSYKKIKNLGIKICIVSPELQGYNKEKIKDFKEIISKNSFEIDEIVKLISPSRKTRILDVGCGTGHHTGAINKQLDVAKSFIKNETMQIIGIDSSQAMINEARSKYPSAHFKVGDAMNPKIFDLNQFTDILCMYFTIYYFQNKRHFFDNCMDWLLPGGCLFLHLVDRENFDPILPPGNPLYIVSPQKYAKQRITNTNINFDDFNYKCNFKLENDIANFEEKIKFKNGNTRVNKHQLYMEDTEKILLYAQQAGFTLHSIIDLINVGYEYQFVYVFTKP